MELSKEKLTVLFENWAEETVQDIHIFPSSGSNRKYYRFFGESKTAIGVIGEDSRENLAFIEFSTFFKGRGLNVPEIYGTNLEAGVYLQEDLDFLLQFCSAIIDFFG